MSGLVEELQKDATESAVPLPDLLRKALVVARKLGIKDFEEWISHELNGYPADVDVPIYRYMTGEIKAFNDYNGYWMPLFFEEIEIARKLSKKKLN
jgi:hypothetical protein